MSRTDWLAVFDDCYTCQARRETRRRVWREVYGDDYAEHADPYSFISRTELDQFAEALRVGSDDFLVDLGCGRGGPGLVVTARTGARLLGLDISEVALEEARHAVRLHGLDSNRIAFQRGDFADTGLPDGSTQAVMSVDALTFAADKQQALDEIFRILAPGGRLVFTSWDYLRTPEGRPPQVPDHRPLLERAGFRIRAYEETRDWRHRIEATNHGLIDRRDELATEEGEEAADAVVASLRHQLEHQIPLMDRRVLAVGEKTR